VLHRASGRWRLGLLLALTTMTFWATLPVALKVALDAVDFWTLTWFRFLGAAVVTGAWLLARGHLAAFARLSRTHWLLLIVAAVMLTSNYVLYLVGLDLTTPATTQLLIQLGPLLLALGGIFIFRERFSRGQWFGLVLLVVGLLLFFTDQLTFRGEDRYLAGAGLIALAAATWATYALSQKQLLTRLRPISVMGFIYAVAALLLWPMATPSTLNGLDGFQMAVLLYCAINTLGAYGCFAESLAHWDASRVGAVLALTPFLTLLLMELAAWRAPGLVAPEQIATLGWVGAVVVVAGSMSVSLLARRELAGTTADGGVTFVEDPTP
jgi:drug/metabolite transporter (DMT)-like permease